jgi:hypothetical protein
MHRYSNHHCLRMARNWRYIHLEVKQEPMKVLLFPQRHTYLYSDQQGRNQLKDRSIV